MPERGLRTRGIRFARAAVALAWVALSVPLWANSLAQPLKDIELTPRADPWFSLWAQVKASSLPPGVKFKYAHYPSDDYGYFCNSSRTPLYLVTKLKTPPRWMHDLPPSFIPSSMTVSGAFYSMNVFSHSWRRESDAGLPLGDFLSPTQDKAVQLLDLNAYLGSRKIRIWGRLVRDLFWHHPKQLELEAPLPEPLRIVEYRRTFQIADDGPIPLYTGVAHSKPQGWISEVPSGYVARFKLVAGKVFSADRLTRQPSSDGWEPSDPEATALLGYDLESSIPGFKSRQIRRDRRPRRVRPPAPQPFRITAFYGKRKVTIRGRVLYDLNPNYRPLMHHWLSLCNSPAGEKHRQECANAFRVRHHLRKPPRHSPTY